MKTGQGNEVGAPALSSQGTALSSQAIEPQASRPSGLQSTGAWTPAGFTVRHKIPGEDGAIADETVAGWVRQPFGLDFRAVMQDDGYFSDDLEKQSAWVLTHLPTGWATTAIFGTFEEARLIVDEVLLLGDWNFDVPKPTDELKRSFSAYRQRRTNLFKPERTIPPWHRLAVGVEPLADQQSAA